VTFRNADESGVRLSEYTRRGGEISDLSLSLGGWGERERERERREESIRWLKLYVCCMMYDTHVYKYIYTGFLYKYMMCVSVFVLERVTFVYELNIFLPLTVLESTRINA